MTYAFEAEGLRKRFGTTQALDGVDLAAREGTVLGVLGPNGAGKTTAVRILATLLRPDAGRAVVGGYDVVTQRPAGAPHDRPDRPVRLGRRGPHRPAEPRCSSAPARPRGQRRAKSRADELLEWFDLTDAAGRPAKTYSGGMRRRLDLAASLVGRPVGDLPRRADHRPRPGQARGHVGRRPQLWSRTGRPCC